MKRNLGNIRRAIFGFACLNLVGLGLAMAQEGQLASEADLNKFQISDNQKKFQKFKLGEETPTKEDRELLQLASRYYIYFMTLKTRQQDPRSLQERRERLLNFELYYTKKNADKNKEFRKMFAEELIKSIQQVFALKADQNRMAYVNTAVVLPDLISLDDEMVGPFLLEVVQKEHDVARLYAFKALQEYFRKNPMKINKFAENADRQKESARIQPVIDFVLKSPKDLEKRPEEEQDGYRYVRGEAVRVLGESRIPALALLPELDGEILSPVGSAVLKVLAGGLAKDPLPVVPSLEEKLEAALAVTQLNSRDFPRFNADLAVGLLGAFILEFATEYRKDYGMFAAKVEKVEIPPRLPWKLSGERLREGINNLVKNLPPDSPAGKNIKTLQQAVNPLFDQTRGHKQMEEPFVLQNALRAMPQPSSEVFRNSKYALELTRWPPF